MGRIAPVFLSVMLCVVMSPRLHVPSSSASSALPPWVKCFHDIMQVTQQHMRSTEPPRYELCSALRSEACSRADSSSSPPGLLSPVAQHLCDLHPENLHRAWEPIRVLNSITDPSVLALFVDCLRRGPGEPSSPPSTAQRCEWLQVGADHALHCSSSAATKFLVMRWSSELATAWLCVEEEVGEATAVAPLSSSEPPAELHTDYTEFVWWGFLLMPGAVLIILCCCACYKCKWHKRLCTRAYIVNDYPTVHTRVAETPM